MEITSGNCPICYELFNVYKKPYLLLTCGHTFCGTCIEQIKKECLEDHEKFITLSEFYRNQNKKLHVCDSETSIFSDNCRKKSYSSSVSSSSEKNQKNQEKNSQDEDSYEEIEDKINTSSKKNSSNSEEESVDEESKNYSEECEEDEENEDESSESNSDNDDNSEKSFNNINDITSKNNKENEKNKRTFKFKCPFCSIRLKITEKELILNENVLKINELCADDKNNNENIPNNNENNFFCEMCNNVESKHEHNLKYGDTHDGYLFELNDVMFKRALTNLQDFYASIDDMKLIIKEFLKNFCKFLIENKSLIEDSKNLFTKYCKYNSKFILVLKKSKKKLEKLKKSLKEKINSQNNNNFLKEKEYIDFLENMKSFNQLINASFYFPIMKMKLISEQNNYNNTKNIFSNLFLNYSLTEALNQMLKNGYFHFLRNKLCKMESKYIPFYSGKTKHNFLFNSELNILVRLKIPDKYAKTCYESSSDGSTIYCFMSNNSHSKFFTLNSHTKKIKNLPDAPIGKFKQLDTIIYNDKKLFVIGGVNKFDSPIKECCYYDINYNLWEKMPSLKNLRYNKALYINEKYLYVFGGKCDDKNSSYIFDKIEINLLNTWETFTIKNFSANIFSFGFCAYNQNILFVVGGEDQVTEDYVKKGYVLDLKEKKLLEEFDVGEVLENNVHTPKNYRGIIFSADHELYNIDIFNIWKRLHKLNINLP